MTGILIIIVAESLLALPESSFFRRSCLIHGVSQCTVYYVISVVQEHHIKESIGHLVSLNAVVAILGVVHTLMPIHGKSVKIVGKEIFLFARYSLKQHCVSVISFLQYPLKRNKKKPRKPHLSHLCGKCKILGYSCIHSEYT